MYKNRFFLIILCVAGLAGPNYAMVPRKALKRVVTPDEEIDPSANQKHKNADSLISSFAMAGLKAFASSKPEVVEQSKVQLEQIHGQLEADRKLKARKAVVSPCEPDLPSFALGSPQIPLDARIKKTTVWEIHPKPKVSPK